MFETISIVTIVLAAGLLQGLTGFGFVLIALPLLGFFIPIKTIIPMVCLLGFCISFYLTCQLRKSIRLKNLTVLMIASLPGIPLGVYTLKHVPAEYLALSPEIRTTG